MKLYQTMLATDMGLFWISAAHDSGKVLALAVHPIDEDGIVQERLEYGADDLPDLVEKLERDHLAEL